MKWRLSISPQECIFNKKSDKTALRVFWNGDFRVYNCYRCCSRWYFTFNGAECSTPSAIDGIFIVWNDKNFVGNPHRPRHIEGICEKLRKGPVRVGFWTSFGSCGQSGCCSAPGIPGIPGSPGPAGPTGSHGPEGPTGPRGNKGDEGSRGKQGPRAIQVPRDQPVQQEAKECVFKKTFDSTALRVFWNGDFRISNCDDCCNRWYFTFNGAECASPGAIDGIVYVSLGTKWRKNPHRPRHVEGICEELHKGTVRVGFWVGKCASRKPGDAYTGWNSVSRMYVEEVPPPQA
ncbi:unnamed protein product [Porites evermanni]|uniref:CTHRC1 C-terminal domain-containing protein n=1 Tax=Porites evermanni TaxID=104178 RepID=A0ABN8SQ50_9CNID|nr:unnamed protein product [Porites evermanni]